MWKTSMKKQRTWNLEFHYRLVYMSTLIGATGWSSTNLLPCTIWCKRLASRGLRWNQVILNISHTRSWVLQLRCRSNTLWVNYWYLTYREIKQKWTHQLFVFMFLVHVLIYLNIGWVRIQNLVETYCGVSLERLVVV